MDIYWIGAKLIFLFDGLTSTIISSRWDFGGKLYSIPSTMDIYWMLNF